MERARDALQALRSDNVEREALRALLSELCSAAWQCSDAIMGDITLMGRVEIGYRHLNQWALEVARQCHRHLSYLALCDGPVESSQAADSTLKGSAHELSVAIGTMLGWWVDPAKPRQE